MQHIETVTVGSGGAASITFSAIAADWTDLVILFSFRSAAGGSSAGKITFNTSGGTYTRRRLGGDGSSAFSDTPAFDYTINDSARTANTFANGSIYIANYRSAVAKSYSTDSVNENNATGAVQTLYAGLWSGTDPITSITLQDQAVANLVEFSSASLYGITRGSDGTTTVS